LISIVLIDDHPLARGGIGGWLARTKRFTVAGEAGSIAEAAVLMRGLSRLPDVVILDISLGQENGLEGIAPLKALYAERCGPLPAILVCSMYEDPFLIQSALDAGARGYISKSSGPEELVTAIDTVAAGSVYIGANLETRLQNTVYSVLTHREREIVSLVRRSLTNRQIAEAMRLNLRTVENHLAHIYVKTGVSGRNDLLTV
jgi:NarL family two-component system response regulator LiaR